MELKAAVAKELGLKLLTSEIADGGEKNSDQDTGCGKEDEDVASSVVDNTSKTQQGQPVTETLVESTVVVSANGHVVEPAELSLEGNDTAVSDAEVKMVNGVSEVRETGGETESSAANAEVKSNATVDDNKPKSDEVNGEINGASDIAPSPSVPKSKGTWAEVVSNAKMANEKGNKDKAEQRDAGNNTANGVAEE